MGNLVIESDERRVARRNCVELGRPNEDQSMRGERDAASVRAGTFAPELLNDALEFSATRDENGPKRSAESPTEPRLDASERARQLGPELRDTLGPEASRVE